MKLSPAPPLSLQLVNPNNPNAEQNLQLAQEAARIIGLQLFIVKVGAAKRLRASFATVVQQRAEALVIAGDPFFNSRTEQLGALSVRHAIPTIYQLREFAAAGGLMSYGINVEDAYRLPEPMSDEFSRGANPPTFRCSSRLNLSSSST